MYVYIYIYIYKERERGRERDITEINSIVCKTTDLVFVLPCTLSICNNIYICNYNNNTTFFLRFALLFLVVVSPLFKDLRPYCMRWYASMRWYLCQYAFANNSSVMVGVSSWCGRYRYSSREDPLQAIVCGSYKFRRLLIL